MKKASGFHAEGNFEISDDVRSFFSDLPRRGEALVHE